MAELRVVFAGGGTGGHLFPALAIADEIKRLVPDARILFVGTKDKIEARVVPQKGYEFETIWISGFKRRFTAQNFLFPAKVIKSIMQSLNIIQRFRPDVVVGTGGYVSGPVVYAATLKNIPTLIHEQNSFPGFTTKMLGNRVNRVCITFDSTRSYLKNQNHVYLSGNPTRSALDNVNRSDAYRYFGFKENETKKTLLIFGGSLGARTINDAVLANLSRFQDAGYRIIWQTGSESNENVTVESKKYSGTSCWVNAFIDKMEFAYAISDLVVCRAGATTIAELTRLGKPAILIPYPFAAADHQTENAKALVASGAASMIKDADIKVTLWDSIVNLLNDQSTLDRMSKESKKLGMPNAAQDIAGQVIALAGQRKNIAKV